MSYVPLSTADKEDSNQAKETNYKHRNPIYPRLKYPRPKPTHTLQSQITSSLFFQQLIYFNWYYSILFFILYEISQIQRLIYFQMEYGVPIRIIISVIVLFLEICRLQNAFHGNIRESFPQICAFLMISILTIAGQIILISGLVPCSPLEWTILFYSIIFQILEFLVCICTMSKLTQTQKALFLWRNPLGQTSKNH